MLFGHWFLPHTLFLSIRFQYGACAEGTVGAELAHIMLMRTLRDAWYTSRLFVCVACVLLYGYILPCDVFKKKHIIIY